LHQEKSGNPDWDVHTYVGLQGSILWISISAKNFWGKFNSQISDKYLSKNKRCKLIRVFLTSSLDFSQNSLQKLKYDVPSQEDLVFLLKKLPLYM
jgi:hypothetical protein